MGGGALYCVYPFHVGSRGSCEVQAESWTHAEVPAGFLSEVTSSGVNSYQRLHETLFRAVCKGPPQPPSMPENDVISYRSGLKSYGPLVQAALIA